MDVLRMPQYDFTATKIFSSLGMLAGAWGWLGQNQSQLSVIFGLICTVLALLTFIRNGKKK